MGIHPNVRYINFHQNRPYGEFVCGYKTIGVSMFPLTNQSIVLSPCHIRAHSSVTGWLGDSSIGGDIPIGVDRYRFLWCRSIWDREGWARIAANRSGRGSVDLINRRVNKCTLTGFPGSDPLPSPKHITSNDVNDRKTTDMIQNDIYQIQIIQRVQSDTYHNQRKQSRNDNTIRYPGDTY